MTSLKAAARQAGSLYLLFLIVGLVDMYGFSAFMVAGDATATARNIIAAEGTYRISILTEVVTLLLFIPLVVSLSGLLKGVDQWHAILMMLLVSVGVTIGLVNRTQQDRTANPPAWRRQGAKVPEPQVHPHAS